MTRPLIRWPLPLLAALMLMAPGAARADAVLDAAMAVCDRHRTSIGYEAGFLDCHRVALFWQQNALRALAFARDASGYAGGEPPERREQFIIQRALQERP